MAERTRNQPERIKNQLEAENRDLRRRIAALEEELEKTQEELSRARMAMAQTVKPPPAIDKDLQGRILEAVLRLSAEDPSEGLVALPALRREIGITKKAVFDQALLALEKEGKLKLRAVRNPLLVAAESGIETEGRGLLYYAIPHGVHSG